jgi:hypothetical protein
MSYRWTEEDIAKLMRRDVANIKYRDVKPGDALDLRRDSRASVDRTPGSDTAPVSDGGATLHADVPKQSKYRNLRCEWNGEKFDSKRELDAYLGLVALEKSRRIFDLKRQVRFPLHCAVEIRSQDDPTQAPIYVKQEVCVYVADYTWEDEHGTLHVADAKSPAVRNNRISRLKLKWMNLEYGITVELL